MRELHITIKIGKKKKRLALYTLGPVLEQTLTSGPAGESMVTILTDTQQQTVQYADPKDKKGNKAPIEKGSLVWKTNDPTGTVAAVTTISEDPIKGLIVAGAPGICEIWPEADADLGDGKKIIAGEHLGVQVTGGEAVNIGSPVLGTPEEQPGS
jgi:hypothetical protein